MTNELIALIASIVGVYVAISTRRKNNADAAESISAAAKNIVEATTDELNDLKNYREQAVEYVLYLLDIIKTLNNRLHKHKLKITNPKTFVQFIKKIP